MPGSFRCATQRDNRSRLVQGTECDIVFGAGVPRAGGAREPFASELAEPPPPFAMDNEAQLSTAVVTAPHDTLLPKALDGCEGFLEGEIGVLGAAIVPPVFSPPALHVADAQEYWGRGFTDN